MTQSQNHFGNNLMESQVAKSGIRMKDTFSKLHHDFSIHSSNESKYKDSYEQEE